MTVSNMGQSRAALDSNAPNTVALPVVVGLYLFVFLVPIEFSFYIGPLLVTPTRFFLILAAGPVIFASLSRHKLQSEDGFFIGFILWVAMAYFYKRGAAGVEIVGQAFLEIAISYCVARTYLVGVDQFRKLAVVLSVTVAVLGILAIPEGISHYRFLHEVPEMLTGFYYYISDDTRMGLLRSSSTFEHPILFGLFCASLFTFAWYTFTSTGARIAHLVMTVMATALSLSSAALLILMMQFSLIIFERLTRSFKQRTMVFGTLLVTAIVLIESLSNRGVVKLIAGNLTFNPHTAYYRVLQWEHGIDDVERHPFVGINLEHWTKPFWMTDSIDNHWLFTAMNSGVPAVLALWIVMGIIAVKLYKKKRRTADEVRQRLYMAWLIGAASLFLGAWTVTLFGKMLPIFMFFIGIGAAMTRLPEDEDVADTIVLEPEAGTTSPYTRFAITQKRA
ncbi:hypothetical protein FHS72_003300 [Loktanella ponticola]|uniref:O-antigen ligase domain-containing protein n=1 Tax=Yoonia ponticola TaxID=1524255 RepID=A0A7W9F0W0_9RHOB|nr:hypothetical protein [Yoonia ponticola]MBB5723655.1 hypothetical protein [Yoonia ponticola]